MRKKTDTPLQAKDSNTTTKGYERASAILEAARLLLARDGYAALAMRSVAQQVGALIEALLEQTFARYQAGIDERVAAAGTGPRVELFESIIDYFLADLRDHVSSGLFFEIAALANRHPVATKLFDTMMTRARRTLRNLIHEIDPELSMAQCEIRGTLIVAQMLGTMLFISETRPQHKELADLAHEATVAITRIAFGR